jgi:inosine-uridine nucleoside N-ribohydrolase
MRIWLDTDLGSDVDDALALAYALRHEDIELVGVSTVFGDVELRTRLVEMLLEKADAAPVPIVTGLGKPLTPGRPGVMFGHEGIGLIPAPTPAPRMRVDRDADPDGRIDELSRELERTKPDFVVAIGPLTNLGALARAGVQLPRLAIMGGKVENVMLPGMRTEMEEWNWWNDPIAVQHVLAAQGEAPPRVVPLEVTFQTELAHEDLARLESADAFARTLGRLCAQWLTAQRERLGSKRPRVALHDPLTLATLTNADLCAFAHRQIAIDEQGRTTRGAGRPAEVAVDVDAAATRQHLMQTWLGT